MTLSQQIQFERAIESEAQSLGTLTFDNLVAIVRKIFTDYSTQTAIVRNLEKLATLELLSAQSAVETLQIGFSKEAAKATYPGTTIAKSAVTKVPGPLGSTTAAGKTLKNNSVDLIVNTASKLFSEEVKSSEIESQIIGTKANGYKDGVLKRIGNNEVVNSRTASKIGQQAGEEKARQENPDVIGYQWVSILDGRTSVTCQSLNGNKYYYNKSGHKPLPPAHPNCRSTTTPIYSDGSTDIDVETFTEWADDNPDELLDSMGQDRYDLYVKGDLKIERFTDILGNPLSLDELKRKNANAAKKADI